MNLYAIDQTVTLNYHNREITVVIKEIDEFELFLEQGNKAMRKHCYVDDCHYFILYESKGTEEFTYSPIFLNISKYLQNKAVLT
jgi:hypothetical protein